LFEKYEPRIRAAATWDDYEQVLVGFLSQFHDTHLAWRRKRTPTERKRRLERLGLSTRFVAEQLIIDEIWPGSGAERAGLQGGHTVEDLMGGLAAVRSWSRAEGERYEFAEEWPVARAWVDEPPRPHRVTVERGDSYQTFEVVPETRPRPGGPSPWLELEHRGP